MTVSPSVASAPAPPNKKLRLTIILGMLTAFAPFSIDMYLAAFPAIAVHSMAASSRFSTAWRPFSWG